MDSSFEICRKERRDRSWRGREHGDFLTEMLLLPQFNCVLSVNREMSQVLRGFRERPGDLQMVS
jgi:hypothetical protein